MAIRMGYRICGSCGARVQGDVLRCGSCGYSMQENDDWKCDDDAPEITDEKEIAQALQGPDWICSNCGASSSALEASCSGCGNPRERSDITRKVVDEYFDGTRVVHDSAHPGATSVEIPRVGSNGANLSGERVVSQARPAMGFSQESAPASSSKSGFGSEISQPGANLKWKLPTAILGVLGLVGLAIWYFFFATDVYQATVTGYAWERRVAVETYEARTKEGWDVPTSGSVLDSERRLYRTDQVFDHYEPKTCHRSVRVKTGSHKEKVGVRNLGNGRFQDITRQVDDYTQKDEAYSCPVAVTRPVPVYKTWYRYSIWGWEVSSNPTTRGQDREPVWPVVKSSETVRPAARHESYSVTFVITENGKTKQYETTNEAEWRIFVMGKTYELEMTKMGEISAIR